MKKNELKKVLKPLIKECIKECIFEEGVLSGIIKEVTYGMSNQRIVTEGLTTTSKKNPSEKQLKEEEYEKRRQERIRRLNESAKVNTKIDIFENTKSIPQKSQTGSPLAGIAPDDAGVNIDGILNLANGKWRDLI
jgi:hypothetical protein